VLELLQRNAEVSIPFAVSSLGYGFLWNKPGGRARRVRRSITRWVAEAAQQLDYWVSAGSPAELLAATTPRSLATPQSFRTGPAASGSAGCATATRKSCSPWRAKHKRLKIPLACIVIDFFHWTKQGEWKIRPRGLARPGGHGRRAERRWVSS